MPGLNCKKCGGPHLTLKCGKTQSKSKYNNKKNNTRYNNKYPKNNYNKEKFCVKISNIPEDLTVRELYDLIKEWGNIGKINFNNNIRNKTLTSRIKEQLKNGYIKLYGDDKISYGKHKNINFLLKISGIWVSNQTNEFGLTFRFFIFNNHI